MLVILALHIAGYIVDHMNEWALCNDTYLGALE